MTETKSVDLEHDMGLAWVWIVWALRPGEALLVAIASTEAIAERYVPFVERHFPGHKHHVERAPMDHLFGGADIRAVAHRYALKATRQRRALIGKDGDRDS